MKIETFRVWIGRLLLGFVLITIGFAAGRRTAPLPPAFDSGAAVASDRSEQMDRVVVYAAHMTFRCPECRQIEWLARGLVESEFAEELADGSLEFRTVDYMRDTAFARKYDISASTIVVVRIAAGEERGFQRLDEVWTKINDRDEYLAYVRAAIEDALRRQDQS